MTTFGSGGDAAPFPSPEDWRDVWIYFLLVDRFDDESAPPRSQPWDGACGSFQGGSIAGVTARLDYLAGLGAGAIWLSPVLKNCQYDEGSYHGYGIQDFTAIDPRFSSDPERARSDPGFAAGELVELVRQAHARGLYVILDIVLNHCGDVFAYDGVGSVAPWQDDPYPIHWRGADGVPVDAWAQGPVAPTPDAAVWPAALQRNELWRRRGNAFTRPGDLSEAAGDFFSLKELVTDYRDGDGRYPVRDALIDAYRDVVSRYDVDGFRIDTLKYVEPEFARLFGNAMREFALSIGKRNFLTFGEVYDGEDKISRFIGRRATDAGDLVGVDAALDFPLFFHLPSVAKGFEAPSDLAAMFEYRKQAERDVISSHGEASAFFVTFLDNHDQHARFYYRDPGSPERFDDQVTLALACLFALQGIACVYYGTEQGLHGSGDRPEAVREALWGKPEPAFDLDHPFCRALRALGDLRRREPALRYGRQYFRPLSGDGVNFGLSAFSPGIVSFSRILSEAEVVVVANTSVSDPWSGEVVVDRDLNPEGSAFAVRFANRADPAAPGPVTARGAGSVSVLEVDGSIGTGPVHALPVSLRPAEVQVLGRS